MITIQYPCSHRSMKMGDSATDASTDKTKEEVVNEIIQLRKNIKQKHRALKRDILESEELWENKLKPISEPLKLLVEEGRTPDLDKNPVIYEPIPPANRKRKLVGLSDTLPPKRYISNPSQGVKRKQKINHPLQPEYESDYDYGNDYENESNPKRLASHHSKMDTSEVESADDEMVTEPIHVHTPHREVIHESPGTGEELIKTPQGKKLAKEFIDKNFKGKIARDYFLKLIQGGKNIDYNYGVRVERDSWMIGSKELEIDDNDLIIDGTRYKGTPGLYELIFMNKPNDYIYTEEDLNVYSEILRLTNAHRVNYSNLGRVKSNKGNKYRNIISQIANRNSNPTHQDMTTYSDMLSRAVTGSGILLTNAKPKYVYYDDPNEIVDRLRILLASQQAGNNAHEDEINSIMEELNEIKPVLSKQIHDVETQ
jgi:hypothetical protein